MEDSTTATTTTSTTTTTTNISNADMSTTNNVNSDKGKPYKIKDVTRNIKKSLVASTLEEIKLKSAEKFGKSMMAADLPAIHLDCDGTEIDDEDYFQTLEPNVDLIAVFSGEQWTDPTQYVTITTSRQNTISKDTIDHTSTISTASKYLNDNLILSGDGGDDSSQTKVKHLKSIVGQLKNNLCNVTVLSEPDLELLSNMDPNSVADITGRDFMEQLKEASGRILYEKREALYAIELLKLFAKHKGFTSTATTISIPNPNNNNQ